MSDNSFLEILSKQFPDVKIDEILKIGTAKNLQADESSCIFITETLVNDFRDINSVFRKLHVCIGQNGYLIIKYKPQTVASIKKIGSVFRFIFKRALPKIPVFNLLYNPIFNRKNISLSKAEVWGRLMYCGFDVQYEKVFSDIAYILCKKIKAPDFVGKPSYYPVVRLNRVGYKGKIIKIYKVRSMYAYSEFIQKKVFDMRGLDQSGKFPNDFRITEYGKFIRKIWLDELPQIINIIKYDIKLVGIRAMSEHYFTLYPKHYQ